MRRRITRPILVMEIWSILHWPKHSVGVTDGLEVRVSGDELASGGGVGLVGDSSTHLVLDTSVL